MAIGLTIIPGEFAICRLASGEPVPTWAGSPVFSLVTRTPDELSIICPAPQVPANVKHEAGWRLLKLQGPFPFTTTGVLASVLNPLAASGVSILATSTFDTDYVLVKSAQLDVAREALLSANHCMPG